MKTTPRTETKPKLKRANGLRPEYRFDYKNSKPNRFANLVDPGAVAILLDPDVAQVFKSGKSVNSVLRALMTTMPSGQTKKTKVYPKSR